MHLVMERGVFFIERDVCIMRPETSFTNGARSKMPPSRGPYYIVLYTCTQNPRLRTVYRQRKRPLPAPVRKIMALGRKIMAFGCRIIALECKVFYQSVKCFTHGLRSLNGAVQRRLATQTVTMLTSCLQVFIEVELQSAYPRPRLVGLRRGFVLHFQTRSVRNAVLASCIGYYFLRGVETRV